MTLLLAALPRLTVYGGLIPAVGWMASGWVHLPMVAWVLADVAAAAIVEMLWRGAFVVTALGVKGAVPAVLGVVLLNQYAPAPTRAAVILFTVVVGLIAAGLAGYAWMAHRLPPVAGFYRPLIILLCLTLAALTELAAASAALLATRVDLIHVVALVAPTLVWWLAYRLRRGRSWPRVGLRDVPGRFALAGGAHS